jgi:hypothetical protein
MAISTTYICDRCGANIHDTELGKLFGPLIITIRSPMVTNIVAENHFCSVVHASQWILDNVGKTVLT